jgi:hypothetical protein
MEADTDLLRERTNRSGIDFLFIDLDVANTLLDIAEGTQNEETARRNQNNARKAYDTLLRLLPKLRPNKQERQELDRKLSLLRDRLQTVGEQF